MGISKDQELYWKWQRDWIFHWVICHRASWYVQMWEDMWSYKIIVSVETIDTKCGREEKLKAAFMVPRKGLPKYNLRVRRLAEIIDKDYLDIFLILLKHYSVMVEGFLGLCVVFYLWKFQLSTNTSTSPAVNESFASISWKIFSKIIHRICVFIPHSETF